jgi:ribose 5-phosphate isomerase RpiB
MIQIRQITRRAKQFHTVLCLERSERNGLKMKIAVVTEVSTSAKNHDVIQALNGLGHEVYNLGMKNISGEPELLIVETGFLSALLLNLKCVDFVVGGCGTGQGYFNCAVQYPGVICGLVQEPVDAWLFPQINGGNCVSLALNKGYGWAGDVNLKFIFEKLFSVESGAGYPDHRKIPQQIIRRRLDEISQAVHLPFEKIVEVIDGETFGNVLRFPGVWEFITSMADSNSKLMHALEKRYLSCLSE